jgi:quinol monooxygenase YgiN
MSDSASTKSVIAVGDVYTVLGRRDEVVELLSATQDRVRSEAGCLAYTFAEAVGDPGHYVVTQQWRDEAAFVAHYSSQPLTEYVTRATEFLARPTKMRIHRMADTIHPADPGPMDPRRAD